MFLVALIFVVFVSGPRVKFTDLQKNTVMPIDIEEVEQLVQERESHVKNIRPGNKAEIIWADTVGQKTPYSIVYIHGFSASHEEGMPVHETIAKQFGCNLYLSRLDGHGLVDTNAFENLTPQDLISSTEFAIEVGKALGDSVILMMCSTGSTSGIYLAAGDPEIAAMLHYSPNIDIEGESDELLLWPWGRQMIKLVMGGSYNRISYSEEQAKYWYGVYHVNGLLALKSMIQNTMTPEVFNEITQPTFMAYYYKNEQEKDPIVSVDRMLDFYNMIQTPDNQKRQIAFPNGRHVMTSHAIPSPVTEELIAETSSFLQEIVGLQLVDSQVK